jgi:hypothetical protein
MKSSKLSEIVDELARNKFFGSLELKFEAGQVVLLRKIETIKPANAAAHRDTRGFENVTSSK